MPQKRGEVEPEVRPETIVVYVPAPSPRRRRGKYIVLAVIVITLVTAGIAGYGKISQFFQTHNAAVTTAAPTITVGQIHLTNVVQYAYQDFKARESATVTDQNVQECHPFWPFGCEPVTVTEIVTCSAFVEAGIDYDVNPPKLEFGSGSNAKTVIVTVESPTFLNYGITTTDIQDSSDKYGVTKDVTDRLLASCINDVYAKAHDTQLLADARQNAQVKITADAAAYGFKARVVFLDTPSATPTTNG